jgi:hypothetical protein
MIKINQDPHTGGYAYVPLRGVTGFFGPEVEILPIIKELNASGYSQDFIEVFEGIEGANVLDVEGKRHGLLVRFMRELEEFFADETRLFHRANDVLRGGGSVVAVFPHGHETEWRKVGAILKAKGATDVTHWGNWIIETIV